MNGIGRQFPGGRQAWQSGLIAAAGMDVPLLSPTGGGKRVRELTAYQGELSPQRIASALRAGEDGDLATIMQLFDAIERRDARLAGLVSLRRNVAASFVPQVTPRDTTPLAEQIAEEVEEMLWRVLDLQTMINIADAVGKEVSVNEIYWTINQAGKADIARLELIPPDALRWKDGQMRIRTTGGGYDGEPLQPGRFIVHEHPAKPGRKGARALLAPCLLLFMLRNFSAKDWAIFTEICGMPFRSATHPKDWDQGKISQLLTLLANWGVSGYAAFPEGASVNLHETSRGARGTTPYEALLEWSAEDATICILGQTLTTSAGDSGGRALGEVQDRVRGDLRRLDRGLLSASISEQLAGRYVEFNYGPQAPKPFVQAPEENVDDRQATRDDLRTAIVDLGLAVSQEHVRERLNIAEPNEGETILEPPSASPAAGGMPFTFKRNSAQQVTATQAWHTAKRHALAKALRADRDEAVDVADQAMAAAAGKIRLADELLAMVDTGGSLEKLSADVTRMLSGELEGDEQLADLLAQAMLLGDLRGRDSWRRRVQRTTATRGGRAARRVMAAGSALEFKGDLPFEEAVKFLRDKVAMPREQFDLLAAAARKRAFTASGLSSQRALESLKAQVLKALEEGRTYEQFRVDVAESFSALGLDGQEPKALYTVFHNNVMGAYGAGQWTQMQETEAAYPYWMYLATGGEQGDGRTRASHRALHGKVFRVGDAVAARFFPPWDNNCRCDARPISRREALAEGLSISDGQLTRTTPVTLESEGRTTIVTPVPSPDWDTDPLGRLAALEERA